MKNNLDKHIDAKIKCSFDTIQENAPAHLWENIASQMDLEQRINETLDQKIQNTYLNEQKSSAPTFVWGKIEKELDDTSHLDAAIDEKVKDGLNAQLTKAAPTFLWSSISDELENGAVTDTDLDTKLKESFLQEETTQTPNKVWFAINRQLNIDKTWDNISKILDAKPIVSDWRKRMLRFLMTTALLLLLLRMCNYKPHPIQNTTFVVNQPIETNQEERTGVTTATWTEKKNELKKKNALVNDREQVKGEESTGHTIEDAGAVKIEGKHSEEPTKTKRNIEAVTNPANQPLNRQENDLLDVAKGIQPKDFLLTGETEPKNDFSGESPRTKNLDLDIVAVATDDKQVAASKINWAVLDALKIGALASDHKTEPIQLLEAVEIKRAPKKNLVEGKLAAGAFIVVNSTMLLNNETREGFDKNSLTTNYFGLAANYGLWASYKIIPKGALVAEFSINADNKQAYGSYEKGIFYIKEWVMKYNRISLAYQHDLWSTNSDQLFNTKLVAQAGIYVGVLREAKLFYDGVLMFDKLADFHQFDFGFKVAIGQEILVDKFVIGYGLRSDIGASNIFRGNTSLRGQENQTNIIHLGGYLILGYRF
ncbi:hypothetical protein [Aureispira anguillae]|uniref:Uncharacterized protein n=1 Tax=Aureispira anguillae TaxID=2864201 RepID=A0A916DU28_9BACT|nr:hypothetical protein [Aureispira anguillae]BDS12220.1 hypothetical protein AsAng_0029390 [Aureispira anguillae]